MFENLKPFTMPSPGNTCTISGEFIPSDATCYAHNFDEVRSGQAVCERLYLQSQQSAPEQDESEPPQQKRKGK